jgi:large subunit ribosomal protein L18
MPQLNRKSVRRRIHRRIRKKLAGTPARPRLAVHFSNQHVYAQLIDDQAGRTVAAAASTEKSVGTGAPMVDTAAKVGALVAQRAAAQNISDVVFDRGGFIYHGKVKALADAARDAGLKF